MSRGVNPSNTKEIVASWEKFSNNPPKFFNTRTGEIKTLTFGQFIVNIRRQNGLWVRMPKDADELTMRILYGIS